MKRELKKKKYRIGIDARFYGPLGKGLGRYIQEISDRMIALDKEAEYEFVIFLSPENFDYFHSSHPHVEKRLIGFPWYSWQEQVIFPLIIRRARLDLIHFPHFNVPLLIKTPFIVTIHDLILTRFPSRRASTLPSLFYWLKQAAYRLVIRSAIRRARYIITVSEFTRKDIINKFKADESKLKLTYEGVAELGEGHKNGVSVLSKYKVKKPYLLYVGNAYPHKNLEFLIRAFARLHKKRENLSLVLVGKEDYFYKRLKQYADKLSLLSENGEAGVFFPGYIPDEDLSAFYSQASLYVFPSLYEGFGLPPLEAMAYSCPVLSSDQASLPEILSDAAAYFDPYNENSFLTEAEALMSNDVKREELISKGRERIKDFDWQDCALKTWQLYLQVLNN